MDGDIDLIVSSSGTPGYWLATDMNDIEMIAEEYVKRGGVPVCARG